MFQIVDKPKIFKVSTGWRLRYHYPARSFALFGATEQERRIIRKECSVSGTHKSFDAAIEALRDAYRNRFVETR